MKVARTTQQVHCQREGARRQRRQSQAPAKQSGVHVRAVGGLGVAALAVGVLWAGCRAGHRQELTVSYTGCANFSLRHHSSRHILGVIWGEYALLGKEGKMSGPTYHENSIPQQGPYSVPGRSCRNETANSCLRTPAPIPLSSHFCPTSGLGPQFYLKGRWASVVWGIGMGSELQHSELQPGKQPSTAKKEGTICLSRQHQEGVGGSGDTGSHTVVSGSSSGPTLIMSTKCQGDPLLPWAQWTPVSESGHVLASHQELSLDMTAQQLCLHPSSQDSARQD